MSNKEIAKIFSTLASIMELHDENPFKIKSYSSAYITLRKLDTPLIEMSDTDMAGIKGVGKAIGEKIREYINTGELAALNKYKEITPVGVQEMLQIQGFGPKKILAIWKELEIESIGELYYACVENRLIELKGFGKKTQDDLKQKIEYYQKSKDKFLYATLVGEAEYVVESLKKRLPQAQISLVGEILRQNTIVTGIEILLDSAFSSIETSDLFEVEAVKEHYFKGKTATETPLFLYQCDASEFGSKLFKHSAPLAFHEAFLAKTSEKEFKNLTTEAAVFEKAGIPYIAPPLREASDLLPRLLEGYQPKLIQTTDIKGVVHNHSTYSDGLHSLQEMATHTKKLGYEYFVISDHSKAAFYANGLKEEQLEQQWREIDLLNEGFGNHFKIYKSIECDILYDGNLDYTPEILARFDLVIASVHSILKMDEAKATARILKAIENPATRILGHPTGRLLLSRPGYPLDHRKIIDACAANGVAIELNANPWRLDIDWTWIPYCMQKGVLISINPDAHAKEGILDIRYGVSAAQKGGLTADSCLNAKGKEDFEAWLNKR
jgi:DNA polymerase (family X)